MKILVIGAGSIGKRHAKNATSLASAAAVFDLDADKARTVAELTGAKAFDRLEDALAWRPDGVVVASPHKTHIVLAQQVVDAGADVLIEKPLSHTIEGVDEFLRHAQAKGRQVFIVCNMRYHPAVKALRDHLPDVGDVWFARAQYGEYLPTMRPHVDYRTLYCSHRDQGGGIILDVIHEIDYLGWLFGRVDFVRCETDKRSTMEIDVEDYATLMMTHTNGVRSELHLDYLQQFKRRGCEIVGSKGTLIWATEGKGPEHCSVRLFEADKETWRTVFEDRNFDAAPLYENLMKAFIESIKKPGSHPDLLDGPAAAAELRTVLAAYESAENGRKVTIRHDKAPEKERKQRTAL